MADWLYPTLGALLLLALAVDVFKTAFHAEGRGGPINRRQNRLIWNVVRWAGTLGGGTRPRLLSIGGPLIAVATIAAWSLLLFTGFALIYMPFVLDFHFSPGQPGSALLEAFYYSTIIGATLGHGDVVAPGATMRVLTMVQAVSGFALLTVAVTYVLAVYRELIATHALASALDARLGAAEAAVARDGAAANDAGLVDPLDGDWARSVTLRLCHVLEAHFNYPILHYFRPSRTARALPHQLDRLMRRRSAADERGAGPAASTAQDSVDALHPMLTRYIGEVHSLFVRQAREPEEHPRDPRERLDEILGMMAYEPAQRPDGGGRNPADASA